REHDDEARADRADDVEILEDRIRGAAVPAVVDPLLGRPEIDELVELAAQEAPAALQVAQQRMRLVLRDDRNAPDAGVQAVREREVDDAVLAAEMHGGFDALVGQRAEPCAATPGKYDGQRGLLQIVEIRRRLHSDLLLV